MAAKRSRLGRPSSSGDTTVLAAPIYESTEIRWPAVGGSIPAWKSEPEKSRSSIFTLSGPVDSTSVDRVKFGAFLEKCCYCGKKIAVDDEIFMSSMRAFCTAECREKQLDIEKELEKRSAKPKLRAGKRAGI